MFHVHKSRVPFIIFFCPPIIPSSSSSVLSPSLTPSLTHLPSSSFIHLSTLTSTSLLQQTTTMVSLGKWVEKTTEPGYPGPHFPRIVVGGLNSTAPRDEFTVPMGDRRDFCFRQLIESGGKSVNEAIAVFENSSRQVMKELIAEGRTPPLYSDYVQWRIDKAAWESVFPPRKPWSYLHSPTDPSVEFQHAWTMHNMNQEIQRLKAENKDLQDRLNAKDADYRRERAMNRALGQALRDEEERHTGSTRGRR
ncbi:hypothetical protein F4780DRAFT_790918 [Xylariomycetidae sp. FL0641]|nr:hypothetical protein F4780DRAFT_790918 [Xylariomycetidae sp. FL0641]